MDLTKITYILHYAALLVPLIGNALSMIPLFYTYIGENHQPKDGEL